MKEHVRMVLPVNLRSQSLSGQMLRTALAGLMACSVLLAPVQALAKRSDRDQIAGSPLSTCDPSHTVAPNVSAFSGVLRTSDGRVLWSRRISDQHAMASTTKIMTALLALERGNLDDVVKVSKSASKVPYALGLHAGEKLTVRELIELALVVSSNDAATALAEHVSGSTPAFVDAMNDRARQLGLKDTHFANPHGLDARGHFTSAADLASLTGTAMKLDEFQRIVALKKLRLAAHKDRPKRKLKSTNQLLREYPGAMGGKTGFTNDAKYALVAVAERDGVELTTVILGAPSSRTRFKTSRCLLNWGFKHYGVKTVASPKETVGSVPLAPNPSRRVPARFAEKTRLPVFDLDGPVKQDVKLAPRISVPVFEGQPIGTARLMQGENVLATVTVVAAKDVSSAEETVGEVPVSDFLDRTVTVRAASTSSEVDEFDAGEPVKRTIDLDPSVAAPVAEGTQLGEIVYSQDGHVICRVPAVAAGSVPAPGPAAKLGITLARTVFGLFGAPRMATLVVAGQ